MVGHIFFVRQYSFKWHNSVYVLQHTTYGMEFKNKLSGNNIWWNEVWGSYGCEYNAVFWYVMSCSLVDRLRCFGRKCSLHHLGRMSSAVALIVAGIG